MSDSVLQATIKAYDEYSTKFEEFIQKLKKTQQTEEQVTKSTNDVNSSFNKLVQAKNKAREASEKLNKVLTDMARGEKHGLDITKQFEKAFSEFAAAEKLVEQETNKVNQALIKNGVAGKQAQAALKQVDKALDDVNLQSKQANKSVSSFMQVLGNIGVLYAFQRGLQQIMNTGREFQLTIKEAQAVTGDFSGTLRDLAMASKGGNLDMFGPTELAQAYRELGQAGATTNEIVAATPDILEFGTAALLDMDKASAAVLSTAKSFNISLEDSKQIVDAYTEAMNLGALSGEDFQWMMSSAGAVAKMAGQNFREILSIGSAMRDSGIQAQDAGTSIKSAMMALMSPTSQAQDTINQLGIKIYDTAGKMKQWSDITAEFEKALAPFNDQSKQLILTTIFGSDGIRAMATSLNKGSGYLKDFTEGLENADGATHRMATAMADTLDGAIRKTNSNLERMKILIFEDISEAAVGQLEVINNIITGFNNLGESGRKLIEVMIGAAGLAVAISSVVKIMQTLGITLTATTGAIGGILAIIGVVTGAVLAYKGSQVELTQELQNSVNENFAQIDSIERLLQKYKDLSSKTNLTEQEQEDLRRTIKELTDAVPGAITGFDNMGTAITNVGIASEEARRKMAALREEAIRNAGINAQIAKAKIPALEQQRTAAAGKRDILAQYMSAGDYTGAYVKFSTGWQQITGLWKDNKQISSEVANMASQARDSFEKANTELTEAQAAIKLYNDLQSGKYSSKTGSETNPNSNAGGGGQSYVPPEKSSKSKSPKSASPKSALSKAPQSVRSLIEYAAQVTGLPAEVIAAIAEQESGFKQGSRSSAGAIGIMQLMPGTAKGLGVNPYDAKQNLIGGARYYQQQLTKYKGDTMLALAAYNAGPGNVDKALKKAGTSRWEIVSKYLPAETRKYVPSVLNIMKKGGSGGSSGSSSSDSDTGYSGVVGQVMSDAEYMRMQIEMAEQALEPFRDTVEATTNAISLLSNKEQYLLQVIQSGNGTMYKAVELNKLRFEQIYKITDQQKQLHAQANAERVVLVSLEKQYKETYDPEVRKELKGEIDSLNRSITQSSQAWWQSEQQKLSLKETIKKENEERYNDAYQKAMDLMRHEVSMAKMSTEEQIDYLQKLRNAHKWTQRQMWDIEEDLYRLRKQQLTDYLNTFEEEYQSKLKKMDDDAKNKIKDIQGQIDYLDQQGDTSNREETERKHNERIAELLKQRRYHELRTGREHKEAINDINKEIAEENREWQLQQEEWSRKDKIDSLEKEKEAITDNAEEERRRLEEHYKKVVDLANKGAIETLAALAAKNPEWLEIGENWIKNLMDGISLMEPEFQQKIKEATSQIGGYTEEAHQVDGPDKFIPGSGANNPLVVLAPGQYKMIKNQAALSAKELESYFGVTAGWSNGKVTMGSKSFTPLENINGTAYLSIREVAQALGYKVDYDKKEGVKIYKAAKGGIFTQPAMTMIREAGDDEAVLPLPMLQPMMNRAVEFALINQKKDTEVFSWAVAQIVNAIEKRMKISIDKLLNIEHFENNDGTDIDILSREFGRAVLSLT